MWWHELTVQNNIMPGRLKLGFAMHLVLIDLIEKTIDPRSLTCRAHRI